VPARAPGEPPRGRARAAGRNGASRSRTAAGRIRGAVEAAERNVADLKAKNGPEVDELVCSTMIVHNQSAFFPNSVFIFSELLAHRLTNLVAEDNTIEDTIFYLSNALNSGRINIERFLRVPSLPCSPRAPSCGQALLKRLLGRFSARIPFRRFGPEAEQ
jgi:hypothetical protein